MAQAAPSLPSQDIFFLAYFSKLFFCTISYARRPLLACGEGILFGLVVRSQSDRTTRHGLIPLSLAGRAGRGKGESINAQRQQYLAQQISR